MPASLTQTIHQKRQHLGAGVCVTSAYLQNLEGSALFWRDQIPKQCNGQSLLVPSKTKSWVKSCFNSKLWYTHTHTLRLLFSLGESRGAQMVCTLPTSCVETEHHGCIEEGLVTHPNTPLGVRYSPHSLKKIWHMVKRKDRILYCSPT